MIYDQGNGQFLVMCDEDGCNEQFVADANTRIAADEEAKNLDWKELSDGFHVCPECDRTWALVEALRNNRP